MFQVNDLVRLKGKPGVYRVHNIDGDEVTAFGGPRRQWRTLQATTLRLCTKAEIRAYERAEVGLLEAARGIKPARPITTKGKRTTNG